MSARISSGSVIGGSLAAATTCSWAAARSSTRDPRTSPRRSRPPVSTVASLNGVSGRSDSVACRSAAAWPAAIQTANTSAPSQPISRVIAASCVNRGRLCVIGPLPNGSVYGAWPRNGAGPVTGCNGAGPVPARAPFRPGRMLRFRGEQDPRRRSGPCLDRGRGVSRHARPGAGRDTRGRAGGRHAAADAQRADTRASRRTRTRPSTGTDPPRTAPRKAGRPRHRPSRRPPPWPRWCSTATSLAPRSS